MAALLGCAEPKGLSRLQRPGIWAGKGRVVRASGDHAEHKWWRRSARFRVEVVSATWQSRVFLPTSWVPSGARR